MSANDSLRERIAFGLGCDPREPRVDYVLSCVQDLLRNKICVLTLSNDETIRIAGEHLARELDLVNNVTKPEVSLP